MRALVFTEPEHMVIEDRPTPEPGPGEALVKVLATGICGSDIHGFMGKTGRRHSGQVMGHEMVGRVEGVGDGTDGAPPSGTVVAVNPMIACGECAYCRAGRDNLCSRIRLVGVHADLIGGFAEYMVMPVRNLIPLTASLPVEEAALVEPMSVGYRAATQGGCGPGVSVLVVGGGTIGIACAAAAMRLGSSPILLSEPVQHRREAADALGISTIDPNGHDVVAAVEDATASLGAQCVMDAVGTSTSISTGLRALAREGTAVLIGMERPELQVPTYEIITKERSIVGNFGYSGQHFRETAAWVTTRPPQLKDYVEMVIPLDDAPRMFLELGTGRQDARKVVVVPD